MPGQIYFFSSAESTRQKNALDIHREILLYYARWGKVAARKLLKNNQKLLKSKRIREEILQIRIRGDHWR